MLFTFVLNNTHLPNIPTQPVDNFWKYFHPFLTVFCKEIYNFTPNLDNKV